VSILDELRQAVAKELESLDGVVALRQDGLKDCCCVTYDKF